MLAVIYITQPVAKQKAWAKIASQTNVRTVNTACPRSVFKLASKNCPHDNRAHRLDDAHAGKALYQTLLSRCRSHSWP